MVDQIGSGGGGGAIAREAILAAMKAQADQASQIRSSASSMASLGTSDAAHGTETSVEGGFLQKLKDGLGSVDEKIKQVDDLPRALIEGEVQDIHEVAAQIKKAEFSFKFAMEIRNKLIDSYREVMRMNV